MADEVRASDAGSTRLELWVRPGSSQEGVEWDPWRKRWVFRVKMEARGDEANQAVLRLLGTLLGVPQARLGIRHGHHSHAKVVEVEGMAPRVAEERLRCAAGTAKD